MVVMVEKGTTNSQKLTLLQVFISFWHETHFSLLIIQKLLASVENFIL